MRLSGSSEGAQRVAPVGNGHPLLLVHQVIQVTFTAILKVGASPQPPMLTVNLAAGWLLSANGRKVLQL